MPIIHAHAKINLTLEILGRYKDGYHQIVSVMQLISLHDTLSIQSGNTLKLSCSTHQLDSSDNLVLKAAQLLQDTTGCNKGAYISLEKHIPMDSGLGGGSSDTAATLKALNELWKTNVPAKELQNLASKLGSDVPFFLGGTTALAEGRGEKLTPLPPFPKTWIVLLRPPVNTHQKTQRMYKALKPCHFSEGQFTQKMVDFLKQHDKTTSPLCYNAFEQVAFSYFPKLEESRLALLEAGATSVHLTGAGPTLFTLVENERVGQEICSRLEGDVHLAHTL